MALDKENTENIMPEQSKAKQSKAKQSIRYIGNYRQQNQGFCGSVYSPYGLSPTIRARDYKEPIQVCVKGMLQVKQDARWQTDKP